MFRRCFAILLLFAALAVFGASRGSRGEDKGFAITDPPRPVPAFQFEDGKNRPLDLKNFRGHYVLLNLWATSCVPCAAEIPALNELSKKLGDEKIAVIALTENHDGLDAARLFYKRHNIDHLPVYDDPSGLAPFLLHVRGLPTTLLIDPQGLEIARLEGTADWTKDTMMSFLEARTAH